MAWWRGLTAWSRISLIGVVAAALVAIGLVVYIPRQIEHHILELQTKDAQEVLDALLLSGTLPPPGSSDFRNLDQFVHRSTRRGDFVSVKLWGADGTILYSDRPNLVGQRFPPSGPLAGALAGHSDYEVDDLSDPENQHDRGNGRLFELYMPVERDGAVVGAWEVYRSLDSFDDELGDIRLAVWASVVVGVGFFLVFLVSAFGSLLVTVQRRRLDAERLYRGLEDSQQERRRLTGRLVSAHDDERKEIMGELHDGLGQDLHRVLFGLRGCQAGPPAEVGPELSRLEALVDHSARRLRSLLDGLHPAALEDVGLAASLRGLVDRARREDGLDVELNVVGDPREPSPSAQVAIFRIAQEALQNVARHAETDRAQVELRGDNGTIALRVVDHGRGLADDGRMGLGMWLMRERAEALGGTLTLDSGPTGTALIARIPAREPV